MDNAPVDIDSSEDELVGREIDLLRSVILARQRPSFCCPHEFSSYIAKLSDDCVLDELDEPDELDRMDEFDELDELDRMDEFDELDELEGLDELYELDELDELKVSGIGIKVILNIIYFAKR